MTAARKSHAKSRNGCPQCKRRRIKCDEIHPRCSNCERHGVTCDFERQSQHQSQHQSGHGDSISPTVSEEPGLSHGLDKGLKRRQHGDAVSIAPKLEKASSFNSTNECNTSARPESHSSNGDRKRRRSEDQTRRDTRQAVNDLDNLVDQARPVYNDHKNRVQAARGLDYAGNRALQMDELHLFHHFITHTCYTLSDRPESHQLWRITVPQIAFEHEFLMRAMLAIAALHLAQQHRSGTARDRYSHMAARHQDAALSAFRPVMLGMDSTTCDASFAMSSLIVVYGFESSKARKDLGVFHFNEQNEQDNSSDRIKSAEKCHQNKEGEGTGHRHGSMNEDNLASADDWLPLIRGVNSILQTLWSDVKSGRLNGLLHDHATQAADSMLPAVLADQLSNLETAIDMIRATADDIDACKKALQHLRYSFARLSSKTVYECEVSLSFLWPVMIPQHFIKMLNQRRKEALVILAYYCIILHHLDGYWWMRGWARQIMKTVQEKVSADDSNDQNATNDGSNRGNGNDSSRTGEYWQQWLDWPQSIVDTDVIEDKMLSPG